MMPSSALVFETLTLMYQRLWALQNSGVMMTTVSVVEVDAQPGLAVGVEGRHPVAAEVDPVGRQVRGFSVEVELEAAALPPRLQGDPVLAEAGRDGGVHADTRREAGMASR